MQSTELHAQLRAQAKAYSPIVSNHVLMLQFLCNGLEEDFALKRHTVGNAGTELDLLVQSSGKMLLLHKLLPKLRSEGHKVRCYSHC